MKKFTITSLIVMLMATTLQAQFVAVPFNDVWKYMDRGTNEGTSWRALSFNDGNWSSGSGKFGYGISGTSTTISFGPDARRKYITTYFRKKVSLTSIASFPNLGHLQRDDGTVVYINGTEVFRNNMPGGSVTYTTKASAEATDDGSTSQSFPINSSVFVIGDNIIAVEIHQVKANNGDKDMAFDLKLETDQTAPSVLSINRQSPSTDPTSATSVTFRTTFSENVTGVNASDFALTTTGSVNGVISSVNAINMAVYDVTVAPVNGNGTMRLDLKSAGTGIKDIATNAIGGGFTTGQTYTFIQNTTTSGFSSVTPLSTIDINRATKDKPQAKAWFYASQWWCALSTATGTTVFRLDGTNWTNVLVLTAQASKTDCVVVGNLVHILGVKADASFIYSLEYDAFTNAYKLWHLRQTNSSLLLPPGQETGSIAVDGAGRMWIASAGTTEVQVWWSDVPYTTWSAPITIATGISDDDICALAVIPSQNKIGVFWSNQITKRFGFKIHRDVDVPGVWSDDEVPASQSALNTNKGMADDHINMIVTSDGTLYCATKTGYETTGFPQIILLVRRPSGIWDNVYPVTMYPEGTQPILVVNEGLGKIKVIYTTQTNGGNIVYKESSTSNLSFGSALPLMNQSPRLLNYATSTHQPYNNDVVIIASDEFATPMQAFSVLGRDGGFVSRQSARRNYRGIPMPHNQKEWKTKSLSDFSIFPNPFRRSAMLTFKLKEAGDYTITILDSKGSIMFVTTGSAAARSKNFVPLHSAGLIAGIYTIRLQTSHSIQTLKVIINN